MIITQQNGKMSTKNIFYTSFNYKTLAEKYDSYLCIQ